MKRLLLRAVCPRLAFLPFFVGFSLSGFGVCPIFADQPISLPFEPIDAAYSTALDRILIISASPSQLHIYDAVTFADQTLDLPSAPTQLSVDPAGTHAAVALSGSIAYVDLQTPSLLKTFPLVPNFVMAVLGPQYVYLFASGTITSQRLDGFSSSTVANAFNDETRAVYDTFTNSIYSVSINTGNLYRYDVSGGPASPNQSKSTNDSVRSDCGKLWQSSDGTRIYTRCGLAYALSTDVTRDMQLIGSFFASSQNFSGSFPIAVRSVAPVPQSHDFAFIEESQCCGFNPSTYQDLNSLFATFSNDTLKRECCLGLVAGGTWSFFNSNSSWLFVIEASGRLYQPPVLQRISPYIPLASLFVPSVLCRLADTRVFDSSAGSMIHGGETRTIKIGGLCDLPSTATAYSLNVTAVPRGKLGYLSIWADGTFQPGTSLLNSPDGKIKANAALVRNKDGAVSIFASNDTDIVLDASGYFIPASTTDSGLAFYPLTPCRVVDTRNSSLAGLGAPFLSAGKSREFHLSNSSCGIPANAQAFALNVTGIPINGQIGYLTVWPSGQPQPYVSTLNARNYAVTANAALVASGENGGVSVFSTDEADLLIDIDGYFAPQTGTGLSFYASSPCRVFDSRGSQPLSGADAVFMNDSCGTYTVTAKAAALNATVLPYEALGFFSFLPDFQPDSPSVSTLNAFDGLATSNLAITTWPDPGVYASGTTALIVDVSGYFAP